jgi:hypothetical protein
MKISKITKHWPVLLSLALVALAPLPANALDINGFTTPTDAACAANPACAISRGGLSDVMTVYNPNGSIFQQIFAFGNEETILRAVTFAVVWSAILSDSGVAETVT